MKSTIKTVLFVVVLLALGYFLLPYVKLNKKPSEQNNQNQNQNQTSGLETFASTNFGAKFEYLADQDGDGQPDTQAKEVGDKVYVYYKATPMEQGQWVQKFSKDPNDSLTAAIQKQFLTGYSSKDCYPLTLQDYYKSYDVQAPQIPTNVDEAVIAYPKTTNENDPYWKNSEKCPKTYTAANGISYFWMDKNHPDKYFFFSIGQYGILADASGQKTWQDTFQVTN